MHGRHEMCSRSESVGPGLLVEGPQNRPCASSTSLGQLDSGPESKSSLARTLLDQPADGDEKLAAQVVRFEYQSLRF